MDKTCHCANCGCDNTKKTAITAEEKVENLKKAIADLGFSVEEIEEGEIKISKQNS